jgi:hypothetical protein
MQIAAATTGGYAPLRSQQQRWQFSKMGIEPLGHTFPRPPLPYAAAV